MSYILEALKKSEQERRRGEMPEITRFDNVSEGDSKRVPLWPIVAIVLIAVNIGLLIVWAPWQSGADTVVSGADSQPGEQRSSSPTSDTQSTSVAPTDIVKVKPLDTTAKVPPRKPTVKPVPAEKPRAAQTAVTQQPSTKIAPAEQEPEIIRPSTERTPIRERVTPSTSYLPQLQELPEDIQRRVPDMSFSSHMYSSEPRFRSIIINGRRLKEGQYLNDQIRVREITDSGVVLDLEGTLFEVDVLGQWVN